MDASTKAHVDVCTNLGQWDRVMELLAPVVASNPDDPEVLCRISVAQLGLSQPALALHAARAATAARPEDAWALRLQSAAFVALKKWSDARAAADRAITCAPMDHLGYLQRASVDASQGRLTKAGRRAAEQALRMAPSDPSTHIVMGGVWQVRRRLSDAQKSYQEALRIDPTNTTAQFQLARLHQRAGASGKSVRLLLGLIRADPSDPRYTGLLRGVVATMLVMVSMVAMFACLLPLPVGGAEPKLRSLWIALVVCVLVQVAAALRLRQLVGPALVPFLLAGAGSRPKSLFLVVGSLAVVDLLLVAGVVSPSTATTTGPIGLFVSLVACFGAIAGAVRAK